MVKALKVLGLFGQLSGLLLVMVNVGIQLAHFGQGYDDTIKNLLAWPTLAGVFLTTLGTFLDKLAALSEVNK